MAQQWKVGKRHQQHLRSGQRTDMRFDMFRHFFQTSGHAGDLVAFHFFKSESFHSMNHVCLCLAVYGQCFIHPIQRDQFCPSTASQRIFKKMQLPWSWRITSLHGGWAHTHTHTHVTHTHAEKICIYIYMYIYIYIASIALVKWNLRSSVHFLRRMFLTVLCVSLGFREPAEQVLYRRGLRTVQRMAPRPEMCWQLLHNIPIMYCQIIMLWYVMYSANFWT